MTKKMPPKKTPAKKSRNQQHGHENVYIPSDQVAAPFRGGTSQGGGDVEQVHQRNMELRLLLDGFRGMAEGAIGMAEEIMERNVEVHQQNMDIRPLFDVFRGMAEGVIRMAEEVIEQSTEQSNRLSDRLPGSSTTNAGTPDAEKKMPANGSNHSHGTGGFHYGAAIEQGSVGANTGSVFAAGFLYPAVAAGEEGPAVKTTKQKGAKKELPTPSRHSARLEQKAQSTP